MLLSMIDRFLPIRHIPDQQPHILLSYRIYTFVPEHLSPALKQRLLYLAVTNTSSVEYEKIYFIHDVQFFFHSLAEYNLVSIKTISCLLILLPKATDSNFFK